MVARRLGVCGRALAVVMSKFDPRYVAALTVVCALLLVVGFLVRPDEVAEDLATASTPELPQLGRFADRRMLDRIADHFSYAATLVEDSVVLLAASGQSGVVWRVGEVVTSARPGPFLAADRTALADRAVVLDVSKAGPPLPFVLLQAPRDASVIDRRPARLYPRGAWLLAVWRTLDGGLLHEPGNLFGFLERDCGSFGLTEVLTNFDFGPRQAGGGIFSLDGGLIAVILNCDGSLVAAEAGDLEPRARAALAADERIPSRYGMRVGQAAPDELAALGLPGPPRVVVRETWWGYGAHRAGLVPGDLILSIEGSPVAEIADLSDLLLPVSREHFDLEVWGAGGNGEIRLPARPATAEDQAGLGFVVTRPG